MNDQSPSSATLNLRHIFYGGDGLRAGWSLLLYGLLFAATLALLTFALHHTHILPKPPKGQTETPPYAVLIGESLQIFASLIPAFIVSRIERRSFTRYGLAAIRLLPDFAAGLLWGLTALSLLVGTLLLTHTMSFGGLAIHGASALVYALEWALGFFLVGIAEEFLFRGYLLYTLSRGIAGITRALAPSSCHSNLIGFSVSAFLFSVCFFTLAHMGNPGENRTGLLAVALVGIVFAFSLYRTGSLWWAIGFHTSWDWAQSYLYGTSDSGTHVAGHLLNSHPLGSNVLSGGPDGPEGSIFVIPTLLLVALIIHLTLPRRDYPFP